MTQDEFINWCGAILHELDLGQESALAKQVSLPARQPGHSNLHGETTAEREIAETREKLAKALAVFCVEPFIVRVLAERTREGLAPRGRPRVYAVTRAALGEQLIDGLALVSHETKLGIALRSIDPGQEDWVEEEKPKNASRECIEFLVQVRERVEVRPRMSEPTGPDGSAVRDATLRTESVRSLTERLNSAPGTPVAPLPDRGRWDRHRSFELYDQATLYKAQREVLMSSFVGPLALTGPAGTGKTTAIIKRVVQVLALAQEKGKDPNPLRLDLEITDAERKGCPLDSWVVVIPHAHWEQYVKVALEKEGGVRPSSSQITTWRALRDEHQARMSGNEGVRQNEPELGAKQAEALSARAEKYLSGLDGSLRKAANVMRVTVENSGHPLPSNLAKLGARPGAPALVEFVTRILIWSETLAFPRLTNAAAGILLVQLRKSHPAAKLNAVKLKRLARAFADRKVAKKDEAVLKALSKKKVDRDALFEYGNLCNAPSSVSALRQAEATWYGAENKRSKATGGRPKKTEHRDVLFLAAIRNRRLKYVATQNVPGAKQPQLITETIERCIGHLYIDEFENRTTLELAALACLSHPSASAIVYSGDAAQATEATGLAADVRLKKALKIACLPEATFVKFDRRVRQSTRLAAATDALREDQPTAAPVDEDDPGIILGRHMALASWTPWARERIERVIQRAGGPVTFAVVTASQSDRDAVFEGLRGVKFGKDVPVRKLGDDAPPPDTRAAIYVAALEGRQPLHGLEFEGVLVLGADDILKLPSGRNMAYVAMTRAATYLGVVAKGPLPSEFDRLKALAGGTAW